MTPEQKQQRIEQILERQNLNLPAVERLNPEYAEAVRDIDFLLSLVKSQEAGSGFGGPCSACGDGDIEMKYHTHNRKRAIHAEDIPSDSDHLVRTGAVETSAVDNAATSMRSACVEKVKALADEHQASSKVDFDDASQVAFWLYRAAAELESVSIQEQEAKQS